MTIVESRFKQDDRVQVRQIEGASALFQGETGTIIEVVAYQGFCDYWVRVDSGKNVQFSERELALIN